MLARYISVLIAIGGSRLASASTYTVTTSDDAGPGSLRNALLLANTEPGVNTIVLATSGTIALATPLPTISNSVVITGPGANSLAIDAGNSFTVFHNIAATMLTISGVSIENGGIGIVSSSATSDGGCIYNGHGTVVLRDVTISGCSPIFNGGGIYNDGGYVSLDRVTVTGNAAGGGAGIMNYQGTLTISNSTISNNTGGGGAGIYNVSGMLVVDASTISGNYSFPTSGGGLLNVFGTAVLTGTTLSGNTAGAGGAFSNGVPNGSGATVTLTNCTIANNTANYGGGIYNLESVSLNATTIAGNSATATHAGAIESLGTLVLRNTVLAKSTLAGTTTPLDNCFTYLRLTTSGGFNLSDDASCAFLGATGDHQLTSAGLDPSGLRNNGGPTQTIALVLPSAAIDAGACTDTAGTAIATDQRGTSRPQGTACDIGAFELVPTPGETPPGTDVNVLPVDPGTGATPVSVTFSNVTQAGTTTLATAGTGAPPPNSFKLGNPPVYYEVSTTAVYTAPITVCIGYTGISFGNPNNIRLFHQENGAWQNRTSSVDPSTHTVCASVNSLSELALFELLGYSAAVQPPINADGSSVFTAKRGAVPVKFTLAVDGAPTCQLPAATIAIARTAGGTTGTINESTYALPSDTGSTFRIDSCQYIYNVASGALGAGSYRVQIVVADITVGTASFALQ